MMNYKKAELMVYDYIGMCYFYKGDKSNALYYHLKMING